MDWSPDGDTLVYDRRDEDGNYQLFVCDVAANTHTCITESAVSGGPSQTRHKGFPAWHPSGETIVCQVEMETHNGSRDLSEPGRGHQCDVWVCRADGSQWWKLTNYSGESVSGCLNPRFNHAGNKLLWARKIGAAGIGAPFGEWDLQLADYAVVDGTPALSNVTTLTPGTKTFYEAHGFSRDDTKLYFTSDPDTGSAYGFDIFACDLDGSNVTNLTASDAQWDEHAHVAKHADRIAYLSSQPYPAYTAESLTGLKGETFVMHADGSNKRQVTHFNVAGFAEYDSEASVATVCSWHPRGDRLAVAQLMLGDNYDLVTGRKLWIVNFNGVYS